MRAVPLAWDFEPCGPPASLSSAVRQCTTTNMSVVRTLQRRVLLPDWLWVILILLTVAGSILTGSIWFLAGLIALVIAQGFYLVGIARCPACSGRFSFHRGNIPGSSTRYRLQLECKQCHIIWDTGRIRDDSSPNS